MFESWSKKLKERREGAGVKAAEPVFKPYDEEEAVKAPAVKEESTARTAPAVITNTAEDSNIELKVVRPEAYEEVSTIADYLLDGCTVVLNLELLDNASIIRMLDFLNGVTYSTDGEIKNVSRSTYIITPNNVDVSDD